MDRAWAVRDRRGASRFADEHRGAARFAMVVLGLLAHGVGGHQEEFPKRDRLVVRPAEVQVVLSYVVPGGDQAQALRRIFDRDRTGALDPAEQAALRAHLTAEAMHFVALEIDGAPMVLGALRPAGEDVTPLGDGVGSDRLEVAVTLAAQVTLGDRRHRLLLSDRHKDRRQPVPVTVSIEGLRPIHGERRAPLPLVGEGHPLVLELVPLTE